MSTHKLTAADEKIVEAMARAECEALGVNPDTVQTVMKDDGYRMAPPGKASRHCADATLSGIGRRWRHLLKAKGSKPNSTPCVDVFADLSLF